MVLATLVASGACSSSESQVAGSGHRGLAFDTVSEVAAGGDFAVVFEVLSERDFGYSDIQRPADGSPGGGPDEFEGATLPEVSELLGLARDELLNVDRP